MRRNLSAEYGQRSSVSPAILIILNRELTEQGEVLPRQLFELAIQAAIGTKVVARETLSAMRKDVTAGLYGGQLGRSRTDSHWHELME